LRNANNNLILFKFNKKLIFAFIKFWLLLFVNYLTENSNTLSDGPMF
jgi:hypothetical protein